MLNFNKKDAHVYPFDESPGAGIIMDVDLEQLIRESPAGEDIPDPRVPPEEADHA